MEHIPLTPSLISESFGRNPFHRAAAILDFCLPRSREGQDVPLSSSSFSWGHFTFSRFLASAYTNLNLDMPGIILVLFVYF